MEEKKNKFFDFDIQEQIDNPNAIKKEEPVEVKPQGDFSKVFGGIEINEEEPKGKFSDVFNIPKENVEVKPTTLESVKTESTFENIFAEKIVPEVKEEKKDIVPTNSSTFFNVETKVETPEIEVKKEEDAFVEKIGDNPMVDYDRINKEAKENAPVEEEKVELPKEEGIQANNTTLKRVNMGGSDLMKLRMQRK